MPARIPTFMVVAALAPLSAGFLRSGVMGDGGSNRDSEPLVVLVHSPLVGPATWSLLVPELRARNVDVVVPTILTDSQPRPFWRQHVQAVVKSIHGVPASRPLLLMAHSGAGILLPAIREALGDRAIAAYVFVDAIFPDNMKSRLDLFESPEAASAFRRSARNGFLPVWREQDLRRVIPDEHVRRQVVTELRPLPLAVYEEPVPVFASWPDAPCAFIQFTATYAMDAKRALNAGCLHKSVPGTHFQMLADPGPIADVLATLIREASTGSVRDFDELPGGPEGRAEPPDSDGQL
jgi:hypothetical protein